MTETEDAIRAGDPQEGTSALQALEASLATWSGRQAPNERVAVAIAHLLEFAYRYQHVKPPTPPSYRFVRDPSNRSMYVDLWRINRPSNGKWFNRWADHFLITAKHYHSCLARALLAMFERLNAESPRPNISLAGYQGLPAIIRQLREASEWTPNTSGLEEIQYYESVEAAARAYPRSGVAKMAERIAKEAAKPVSDLAVIAVPTSSLITVYVEHSLWVDGTVARLNLTEEASAIPGFRGFEMLSYGSGDGLPASAILLVKGERPAELADRRDVAVLRADSEDTLLKIYRRAANYWLRTKKRRNPVTVGPILGAMAEDDVVFLFA